MRNLFAGATDPTALQAGLEIARGGNAEVNAAITARFAQGYGPEWYRATRWFLYFTGRAERPATGTENELVWIKKGGAR